MRNIFKRQNTPYDNPFLRWFYPIWRKVNRPWFHRRLTKEAVKALNLRKGNRLLEIACGPGYSFEYVIEDIGENGEIIAIDYSAEMLNRALQQKEKNGWNNIQIIQKNASAVNYLNEFDGAISILGLSVVPDWKEVLRNMVTACKPGKNVVIADSTKGVSLMSAHTRDITSEMEKCLTDVNIKYFSNKLYFVATGKK